MVESYSLGSETPRGKWEDKEFLSTLASHANTVKNANAIRQVNKVVSLIATHCLRLHVVARRKVHAAQKRELTKFPTSYRTPHGDQVVGRSSEG